MKLCGRKDGVFAPAVTTYTRTGLGVSGYVHVTHVQNLCRMANECIAIYGY